MGWKRKRSSFSSHERVTFQLRKATVQNSQGERPENDGYCSIVRSGRKKGRPTVAANMHIHQERSKIRRVVIPSRKRIAERHGSQNRRGIHTSRVRNARNNAIPANENYRNAQQVQKRIPSIIVQHLIQVEVWTKHGIRFSRVKSARNGKSDSHTQRILSKSSSKESEYQNKISKGCGYRDKQNLRVSRDRCSRNQSPVTTQDASTMQVESKGHSVKGQILSEIPGEYKHQKKRSLGACRNRYLRNDSPTATAHDKNTVQVERKGPSVNCQTLSEITREYEVQNDHNLRVCIKTYLQKGRSMITTQDANTVQAAGKSTNVKDETLGNIKGKYQFDFHGSNMKTVRNRSPSNISDLNSQKASSVLAHVESRFPNEIEEGYESSTENRIRFSRLRNERDNTSVTIKQNPHVQNIPNISSSTKNRSLREALEKYKCSICLDTRHRRAIRYLPCHHRFHKKCINKWLNENEICPICQFGY